MANRTYIERNETTRRRFPGILQRERMKCHICEEMIDEDDILTCPLCGEFYCESCGEKGCESCHTAKGKLVCLDCHDIMLTTSDGLLFCPTHLVMHHEELEDPPEVIEAAKERARIARLLFADKAGTFWARQLKAGDPFMGARPAANERYPGDESCSKMFVFAALDVLEKTRLFTSDGRISRIQV
jgi:hypothetical protein